MAVPLYDTLNIPTGILASTTSELLLARDTDGDVKLFSGTSYLRGSGMAGYLPVYSTANTLMNSVLFQSNGNIGIGLTTNIDHKLKVGGGIYGDYLQVNTAYSNGNIPGRFYWDADHDLIEVGLNSQFSARLPQDEVWSCIAATNITKGQLVYASGTSGSSGKIQATPFVANSAIPARFLIGIATENAAPGESFHAMRAGILRGVDTSMYTAGQDLWASITTVGGYQTTAPQAPNQKLSVAFVITSHTNVGELAVRISNGFELSIASDTQITSPATNQLLRYNNNRWENWTHDFAKVTTAGTVNRLARFVNTNTIGDSIAYIDGGRIFSLESEFPSILLQGIHAGAIPFRLDNFITGISNSGFSIFDTISGVNRFVITASGNVGIGVSDPTFQIETTGVMRLRGSNGNAIYGTMPGITDTMYAVGDANAIIGGGAGTRAMFWTNGVPLAIPNGNILIGTITDLGHKLQVNGDIRQTSVTNNLVFANSSGVLTAYANTASIALGTGTGGFLTKYTGSGSTQNIGNSLLYELGSNIGLNKTTPIYNFDINGTLGVSNTLSVYSTTSSSKLDITTNANGVISTYSNHAINSLGANFFVVGRDTIFTSGAGVGYKMQVDSGTTGGKGLFVNGDIYSTATITSFSDIRLKSELERIENAIDKIRKINGYTYSFNDKRTLGLISQEVKNIVPEAIEEKGGYMTLNYQGFSAVIVEAIKELSDEIKKLKERCQ